MSSDWTPSTVGAFCPFTYGKGLPDRDRNQSGSFPVVSSAGVIGKHDKPFVHSAGIVIGRKGTIGSLTLLEKPFWPIDTAFFIKDEPQKRDLYFCYYLLKTLGLDTMNTDSAVPGLNRENAHKLEVLVPPLSSQKAIGHFARAYDQQIETLRRQNTALEAIAQRLFRSWFVNFDPVHAKAAGKEPEAMSAELAALFPSEFEDSELGPIPKGWLPTTFGNAFLVNPRRSLAKDSMAPHLEMANVTTKGHRPSNRVPLRAFTSGTKYMNGDTLLARITPCLENGKTAFVDFLSPNQVGWGSTEFIVIRSKEKYPEFWSYLLARQANFRAFAIKAMTGTSGRQRVDISSLQAFKLTMPPVKLAEAVIPVFSAVQKQMKVNAEISMTLAELRDHLLPRLISGKLSLEEAERVVEEAVAVEL